MAALTSSETNQLRRAGPVLNLDGRKFAYAICIAGDTESRQSVEQPPPRGIPTDKELLQHMQLA